MAGLPSAGGPSGRPISRSPPRWATLGETLAVPVQICGRVPVEIDGSRPAGAPPGRQGRVLFCYAVLRRLDVITRDELVDAVWGDAPPRATESALAALLSKLRRALHPVPVDGHRIALPAGAWVDLEGARAAMHRAES